MHRFDAILFDATGTLFYPYPSVGDIYARSGRKFGLEVSGERLNAAFGEVWRERAQKAFGVGSRFGTSEAAEREWWRTFVGAVFGRCGASCPDECFDDLYAAFARPEAWRVFPEVEGVLLRLSAEGYVLGIVSNFDSRLKGICEGLELLRHVKFVLISSVFGVEKPDPRIFLEAVRLAGTTPARALYVGDDYRFDIEGARAAGLRAAHLRRREAAGEGEVSTLTELLGILTCVKRET
ncbi:MAG: HAD-IA family hydrolase [Planctomycetes bacterium]|nr:HAD-IA family hydrolase [Planctomycetota bacterium]